MHLYQDISGTIFAIRLQQRVQLYSYGTREVSKDEETPSDGKTDGLKQMKLKKVEDNRDL